MSHIFISYCTANVSYANRLAERLQAEGFDVWIDNSQLHSSDNWWESIVVAVYQCAAFIVIMSPEARESRWIQREVMLADIWKKPVFPLLLEGKNWEILVLTQYHDVRNRRLPTQQFYDKLADYAPRQQHGEDVTSPARADHRALDTTVLEEITNPPEPEDVALSNDGPIRSQGWLTEAVAILIAAVITGLFVIAAALIQRGPVAETPNLTATHAITQTAISVTVPTSGAPTVTPKLTDDIAAVTASVIVTLEYPCKGTIVSSIPGVDVEVSPDAPSRNQNYKWTISDRSQVRVLNEVRRGEETWYQIESNNQQGWILSEFIPYLEDCS